MKSSSKIWSLGAAALGLLVLVACENMAHLDPANDLADSLGGQISAHFTSFSSGNGTIEAIGYGGEVLKGSYAPVSGDYKFGDIFKAVYGDFSINPAHADNGTQTVATLTGNKGTSMQCEFYDNQSTGNGFGGCKTLTGALYRLQY